VNWLHGCVANAGKVRLIGESRKKDDRLKAITVKTRFY
jgi:hypothetical protein